MNKLKHGLYNNINVANGCLVSNNTSELKWKYEAVQEIIGDYKFDLQHFATFDFQLKSSVDNV